jgi:hypothetical protein
MPTTWKRGILGAVALAAALAAGRADVAPGEEFISILDDIEADCACSTGARSVTVADSPDWRTSGGSTVHQYGVTRHSNRGGPNGSAARMACVLLQQDGEVVVTVRPSPFLGETALGSVGCELQVMHPASEETSDPAYRIDISKDVNVAVVVASSDEDPELGTSILDDIEADEAVDLRMTVTDGTITFMAREFGGGEEDWVQVASTSLPDPEAILAVRLVSSSLDPGESYDLAFNRLEGAISTNQAVAGDRVAAGYSQAVRSAIVGCASLGGLAPDPVAASEEFHAAADASRSILDDLEDLPDSKALRKAERGIEAGAKKLEKAADKVAEGKTAPAAKFALKGRAQIEKTIHDVALLFDPGAGGGGGGGGGATLCIPGSRALGAGESCTASWTGHTFTASSVKVAVQTEPSFQINVDYYDCTSGDDPAFGLFWYFTPEVGTPYDYGSLSGFGAAYSMLYEDGFTSVSHGSGTLTFTEVDPATGTYAGTFTFSNSGAGVEVTDGSFRIVGAK